jgi:BolA protein
MTSSLNNPVQNSINTRLTEALSPIHLAIENESYKHSVPKGSETHFKVIVVSEKFEGVALIEQHRMVNEILAENLASGVHALAIKTMTPKKWQALNQSNPQSQIFTTPNCLGGSKHDKK